MSPNLLSASTPNGPFPLAIAADGTFESGRRIPTSGDLFVALHQISRPSRKGRRPALQDASDDQNDAHRLSYCTTYALHDEPKSIMTRTTRWYHRSNVLTSMVNLITEDTLRSASVTLH